MNSVNEISFAWPYFLLLLIPAIYVIITKIKKQNNTIGNAIYMSAMVNASYKSTWRVKALQMMPYLQYLGLVSLIIVLARPQKVWQEEKVETDGIDIILAIDLSMSMLALDFDPNRLEVSKNVAIDFIEHRPYDRIGLVVFSGESYTQCPLTTDRALLKDFVKNLQVGYIAEGTAIGMGLATAVNRLRHATSKSKVIILLTDGDNNTGYIDPMTSADLATEYGIKVYTIGVGTQGHAQMPFYKDPNGRIMYRYQDVVINMELLQDIATKTGGKAYRATDINSLEKIYADIDQLEKTKIDVQYIKKTSDYYIVFLIIAALCIGLPWIIERFILRSLHTLTEF